MSSSRGRPRDLPPQLLHTRLSGVGGGARSCQLLLLFAGIHSLAVGLRSGNRPIEHGLRRFNGRHIAGLGRPLLIERLLG